MTNTTVGAHRLSRLRPRLYRGGHRRRPSGFTVLGLAMSGALMLAGLVVFLDTLTIQ